MRLFHWARCFNNWHTYNFIWFYQSRYDTICPIEKIFYGWIIAIPCHHHLVKREIFFPNFINLAVAPFDNAAKLFLNFHDNFTFVECSPFEHSKKIFLILYLLLLNDTFSTRKPLFRIENIFLFKLFRSEHVFPIGKSFFKLYQDRFTNDWSSGKYYFSISC